MDTMAKFGHRVPNLAHHAMSGGVDFGPYLTCPAGLCVSLNTASRGPLWGGGSPSVLQVACRLEIDAALRFSQAGDRV